MYLFLSYLNNLSFYSVSELLIVTLFNLTEEASLWSFFNVVAVGGTNENIVDITLINLSF